jgi:hypothetical protein
MSFKQWLEVSEEPIPEEGSIEEQRLLEIYYDWLGDQ